LAYDSLEAAAEALSNANSGGSTPNEGGGEQAPQQVAPEVDAGTTGQAPPAPDSFSNIDPNALPPELRAQYANMQGAFTKRMQELSETARMYEHIGDPEVAVRGVELMKALEEDPVFVHQQLSSWLEAQGMSPGEASAAAAEIQSGNEFDPSGEDEYGVPESLRRELDELKSWRQQEESLRAEQAYMSELQREEMAIRQSNPNFTDDDVNAVYELAFAHGGSLLRAETAYKQLQDRWAASYMNQKAAVPAGLNQPGTTGSAQTPQKFDRLDDPGVEKAALAALAAALGDS